MRKHLPTILLILVFLTGLSLLLYPTVSDYWNSIHQSRAIASYSDQVATLDNDRYDAIWASARDYNATLAGKVNRYAISDTDRDDYEAQLNVSGNGVMGYVEIPSIGVTLPIYHGTDEAVLQIAVGHIPGSSLPVGGAGTHCVISGHRGLPSARLFTDIDRLVVGDQFYLHVLDEMLTYEVDQILIVEPDDISALEIEDGKDLCTLVTCTPYGINTHRLLVRGHRTENPEQERTIRVSADALQVEPLVVAPLVAVPILLCLLILLLLRTRRKKQ